MATFRDKIETQLVRAFEDHEAELDGEIERLDNLDDNELDRIRQERLESMKKNADKQKEYRRLGHGTYSELHDEKSFFETCKTSQRVAVLFGRPSTWRCEIYDKHLEVLAHKYINVKFCKINAEKSPFLCERLRVLMLPTLMLIKDGRTDHSIIGFDELGGRDEFETSELEELLRLHDFL